MARRYAITAVGNAILDLLRDSLPKDEFGNLPFPLLQSVDLQKGLTGDGVGLYLYRIGVNGTRRNLPPRVDANGKRYRPSLPLDLYYLLVPWAASAERQQLLLGWAMRTLENTPILPAGLLNQHGPQHNVFAANETVELVCDPLSLQDLQNVWEGLKPSVPLTVAYVARMVALDSDVEMVDAPPVQSRGFDAGKGPLL